jgi:PQQ-dependent catabolism-associated CXXCW motif protein
VRAALLQPAVHGLVLALGVMSSLASHAQPPEPDGYRMDDYRAPTPNTVAGGVVLDTDAARTLWESGSAAWIDVLPAPRRPANLEASALWMPLPHRVIPGSLWLPDIGRGSLSPELERYFRDHLESVSRSRRDTPIVLYCQANCWMSWNATKRAASWGYTRVYWYRDGTDGWASAKLPMTTVEPVPSGDLDATQIREILAAASPEKPADFAGRSLENLDLSNVDFKRANLSKANLFGAKLEGADLSGADLSGAKLDLAWIMRANFTDADLSNASLFGPVVSSGLETSEAEAPIFKRTNFSGARIIARLSRFDLRGAIFVGARMGADMKNQSMGLMRTDLSGANLAGANFSKADLGRALMRFANLTGSDLSGATLTGVDLSGADLSGADLTGADATDADFGEAVLANVRGLDTVKGLKLPRQP